MPKRSTLAASAAAVLIAGYVGGFLTARFIDRPQIDTRSVCGKDWGGRSIESLNKILPDSANVLSSSRTNGSPRGDRWSSDCRIEVEGGGLIKVTSGVRSDSPEAWDLATRASIKRLEEQKNGTGENAKKVDTGATLSLSSGNSFSVFFECLRKDSEGEASNLSVDVSVLGSAASETGEHRQEIAQIAVERAQRAHTETYCRSGDSLLSVPSLG